MPRKRSEPESDKPAPPRPAKEVLIVRRTVKAEFSVNSVTRNDEDASQARKPRSKSPSYSRQRRLVVEKKRPPSLLPKTKGAFFVPDKTPQMNVRLRTSNVKRVDGLCGRRRWRRLTRGVLARAYLQLACVSSSLGKMSSAHFTKQQPTP